MKVRDGDILSLQFLGPEASARAFEYVAGENNVDWRPITASRRMAGGAFMDIFLLSLIVLVIWFGWVAFRTPSS